MAIKLKLHCYIFQLISTPIWWKFLFMILVPSSMFDEENNYLKVNYDFLNPPLLFILGL